MEVLKLSFYSADCHMHPLGQTPTSVLFELSTSVNYSLSVLLESFSHYYFKYFFCRFLSFFSIWYSNYTCYTFGNYPTVLRYFILFFSFFLLFAFRLWEFLTIYI